MPLAGYVLEPALSRVKCTQSSSETPNRSKYGLGCTRRGPNGLGLDTAAVPHLAKPQLDTSHASPSRGVPARLGGPETRNLPSSRWSGRGSCQPTVDPKVLPRRACGVAPIQHENCFKIFDCNRERGPTRFPGSANAPPGARGEVQPVSPKSKGRVLHLWITEIFSGSVHGRLNVKIR